jgi:hypothetical protein
MSRKQLENFLEQERRIKLGASITRFAISAEGSDEEKANIKREKVIEKQARINKKRAKKRKGQRRRQRNLKKVGRNKQSHRRDAEVKSEGNQSKLKLGRKTRHQQATGGQDGKANQN